jgi:hypothetical protein
MPKFVCPKDDDIIGGCGTAFEAEPERDGTIECPACGVLYDRIAQQGILAPPDTGEEGACPDRAAFGSCSHDSCGEADRIAIPYFECRTCGTTDHPTRKCTIENANPLELDPDDADLPGITNEERARLQAIDDADYSENRPGCGKIICKFCGRRGCDYACDGSQAAAGDDEADEFECCVEGHDGPAVQHKNGTISCEACGFTTDAEEWIELFGPIQPAAQAREASK